MTQNRLQYGSKNRLLTIEPARRYTLAEVDAIMNLVRGMVNEGLCITKWEIKDEELWYAVEVMYDFQNYDIWYFYKAPAQVL